MNREPLTRRYPYWRVTLAAFVATILVCLLAGAGVANAKTVQPYPSDPGGSLAVVCYYVTGYGWFCVPQ